MRVLIVVQNYPPERGPVRYTYGLATGLAERGDDVTVITGLPHYPTGRPDPGFGRFRTVTSWENRTKVVRIPLVMASNCQPIRRVLGFISFLIGAVIRSFLEPSPDLVISSVPPATVAVAGFLVGLIRRVPTIVILRDVEPLSSFQLRGMHGRFAQFVVRIFMKIYRSASKVVVIHEYQAAALQLFGVDKANIAVIPHGIDLERFDALGNDSASGRIPKRDGRALVVFAGTVGASHDLESFLRMLSDNRIRALPIDYAIVGDGERLPECKRIMKEFDLDHVTFIPPVPLEEVPSVLSGADLLLSSYVDNPSTIIGSKILEYCAAGKPVLLHGPQQSRNYLERIGNGWTCPNGDRERLYASLTSFLESRLQWNELGEKGRRYAEEYLRASNRQNQWQHVLDEVAGTLARIDSSPRSESHSG